MYRRPASISLWSFIITVWASNALAGTILVKPSLTVNEMYDSNTNYADKQNEKGDFVTSVMPRIELLNEQEGLTLNGSYSLSSRYYSSDPGLSYISHNGNIGMKIDLSQRTSLTLADSITYSKDSREADINGIQLPQTGILSNSAAITLSRKLNKLTSVTLRGSDSFSKYDESSLIDSRTDSAGIDIIRELTPRMSANTSYTYTNFHFENTDDAHTHAFQLGLSKQVSSDLSLNLSGGTVYSGEIGDKYDWTAQASLSKRYEMSSIAVGYSRGVSTSSGLTDEITISDRGSLTFLQTLSNTMNVTLSGGYSQNRSEPTGNVNVNSYDATVMTDWRPDSWITVGAGYSRFDQWVEGGLGTNLTRDQVFVNITASSDGWRF